MCNNFVEFYPVIRQKRKQTIVTIQPKMKKLYALLALAVSLSASATDNILTTSLAPACSVIESPASTADAVKVNPITTPLLAQHARIPESESDFRIELDQSYVNNTMAYLTINGTQQVWRQCGFNGYFSKGEGENEYLIHMMFNLNTTLKLDPIPAIYDPEEGTLTIDHNARLGKYLGADGNIHDLVLRGSVPKENEYDNWVLDSDAEIVYYLAENTLVQGDGIIFLATADPETGVTTGWLSGFQFGEIGLFNTYCTDEFLLSVTSDEWRPRSYGCVTNPLSENTFIAFNMFNYGSYNYPVRGEFDTRSMTALIPTDQVYSNAVGMDEYAGQIFETCIWGEDDGPITFEISEDYLGRNAFLQDEGNNFGIPAYHVYATDSDNAHQMSQIRMFKMRFMYDFLDIASSIVDNFDNVDNNAPVEYFNLQGVRVNNPSNGIYIRRQGKSVSKVAIK